VNTIAFNNDLKGLSRPQLRFAMASPIVDLDMLDAATDRFIADSAYLDDRPAAPLRFNADANLTQIINREERQVDKEVLRTELDSRIKDIPGARKTVTIEADIGTAAGGDLSLQVKGTLGEVRPLRDYLEPQIRASSERVVQIVLEFAFENGLKIDSDEPDRLIERLTKFGSGAAYVEATAEI